MITPEILNYIKSELQKGESRKNIKQRLLAQGWQDADIEEGFISSNSVDEIDSLNNTPDKSSPAESSRETNQLKNFEKFKKLFLFILVGSLVGAASVAVITILVGGFNEIASRVLTTLLMVVIHSLFALAFIWDDEKHGRFKELTLFLNTIFFLTVLSFFTSIFGIWKVIPEEIIFNLYQTYFVIIFATLHGNILFGILKKEKYIDIIIYVNYIFIAIVALMLQWVIHINNATTVLGDMFFRILAAAGIIDLTLTILVVIFYKWHIHKHPEIDNRLSEKTKKSRSIWWWIIIIYLFLQFSSLLRYFFL